jgi:hypothetical protein
MLSTLYSNTSFIQVSAPTTPYINASPMAGQLRWNPQNNYMEVSNGGGWQQLGGVASLNVSAEFTQIMDWAREEMARSIKIKQLADQLPTVADALAAYELAAEKLAVIMALADKELV